MDLIALQDFNLVAAHGGFGRASRATGRPKATLSRRVFELEQQLGVRLLERGAHALRLTQGGHALQESTATLLSELAQAVEAVTSGAQTPRGRLADQRPGGFRTCGIEQARGSLRAGPHRSSTGGGRRRPRRLPESSSTSGAFRNEPASIGSDSTANQAIVGYGIDSHDDVVAIVDQDELP